MLCLIKMKMILVNPYDDNDTIRTGRDQLIIDFSETNPFGFI